MASSRRSVDLTFNVASYGEDADPDLEVVYRRAATFRRNRKKQNVTAKLLQENLDIYDEQGVAGIFTGFDDLRNKTLGGPPKHPDRMKLRKECCSGGPVGYLLESMHLNAATLDVKGVMRQHNQPDIDILECPKQD